MAKKELRLAVVIYGGASLAVYMHGVTKELIKLVRASRVLHDMDAAALPGARFADGADPRESDTEAVYFEILQAINAEDDFRVVIDVIAGASAGAINGVMLAKAIVDDARLDAQTPLWLDGADSEALAAARVGPWHKWYLYPALRTLVRWLPRAVARSHATRRKLARLVRSPWFRPPFSGERLCHLFLDGLDSLRASRQPGSTLLPPGQRLDVYASLTDLAGYPRAIRLHEGLVAREREHAAFCRLSHVAPIAGAEHGECDFDDANVPGLVWAARASSSYAGAFPPFRHDELKRVLAARGMHWPGEARFLAERLRTRDGAALRTQVDPATRNFVDGGIVNNKPFGAVLEALRYRPADRRVHRRILYVEPDPAVPNPAQESPALGYFGTVHAAVSSIPRNQPILEELRAIVAMDARVRINQRVVDAHRSRIRALIDELRSPFASQPLSADLVTYLRQTLEDRAEAELGMAFDGYVMRRLWRLVDALVTAWAGLAVVEEPRIVAATERAVTAWWQEDGAPDEGRGRSRLHRQQAFLERFDVSYRVRRLQFLIRRINELEADRTIGAPSQAALDDFKERIYGFVERYLRLRRAERLDDNLLAELRSAADGEPTSARMRALLDELAGAIALPALDGAVDAALADFLGSGVEARVRADLVADYAGFPFFDVLLQGAGTLEDEPDPLTPIRVDRISPADAPALAGVFDGLFSRELGGFLGFFNRGYREHDYLWGRLNGAERLVDLLVEVAGPGIGDPAQLKRKLFETIIAAERKRLPECAALLDRLTRAVTALG